MNQLHGNEQFKPNTTVAAIIHHKGKFLCVEELEGNKRVYNQPAGHLESNESLLSAVKREVFEETGLNLSPDYLSGIYYFHRPDLQLYFLRFCFVFEISSLLESSPQDDEILATHWLSYEEVLQKKSMLRSSMVLECFNDYLAGVNIPLTSIKTNL
jgi:phosphatase NudJ